MKKCIIVTCISLLIFACAEKQQSTDTMNLFVGTYTDGGSEGIYSLRFNPETGSLDSLELKAKLPNPSFLAISKDRKNLFAVQETSDFDSLGGGVTSFSLDRGQLKLLNSKGSGGAHPCHVAVAENNQIAVSNYTGGNVAIFDITDNGYLGERQLIEHNTSDTTIVSHAHKSHFNKDELFVADLGLNALKRYTKQPYGWVPANQSRMGMPEGAGPRHFIFNKNGAFLYVINELNSTITVLQRDANGSYNQVETKSTLASDFGGESFCADIHLSNDGKFLYGSNRGENSIVVFAVNQETGMLTNIGRTLVNGDWPRNFTLDPAGNFLLVANQRSSNITVFKRDRETGLLIFNNEFKMDSPVCLVF